MNGSSARPRGMKPLFVGGVGLLSLAVGVAAAAAIVPRAASHNGLNAKLAVSRTHKHHASSGVTCFTSPSLPSLPKPPIRLPVPSPGAAGAKVKLFGAGGFVSVTASTTKGPRVCYKLPGLAGVRGLQGLPGLPGLPKLPVGIPGAAQKAVHTGLPGLPGLPKLAAPKLRAPKLPGMPKAKIPRLPKPGHATCVGGPALPKLPGLPGVPALGAAGLTGTLFGAGGFLSGTGSTATGLRICYKIPALPGVPGLPKLPGLPSLPALPGL